MKISEAQASVASFHKHVKVRERAKFGEKTTHHDALVDVVRDLAYQAKALEILVADDPMALRLHLELEELAEKFQAMLDGDEVQALDGAADQLYVQLGTASVYDWPLEAAFQEVHASNMTKSPSGPRVRQKGPNYVAPDVAGILERHRNPGAFYMPVIKSGVYQAPDGREFNLDLNKLSLPAIVPLMKDGIQIGNATVQKDGTAYFRYKE